MADLAVWQRTIVDEKGDIIPGAEVSVRSYPGGSLITLYEGPDGAQVKGNPFSTGADGFARFWADSQRAEIVAHGAGGTIRWVVDLLNADEVIGDAVSEATAAAAVAVGEAEAAAGEAEAAADRAEAARDAAQLNAGVYEDTAAGLSATSDGDYFSVPSEDDDEYLILYRNDNGSATEIRRYPSAARVDAVDETLRPITAAVVPLPPVAWGHVFTDDSGAVVGGWGEDGNFRAGPFEIGTESDRIITYGLSGFSVAFANEEGEVAAGLTNDAVWSMASAEFGGELSLHNVYYPGAVAVYCDEQGAICAIQKHDGTWEFAGIDAGGTDEEDDDDEDVPISAPIAVHCLFAEPVVDPSTELYITVIADTHRPFDLQYRPVGSDYYAQATAFRVRPFPAKDGWFIHTFWIERLTPDTIYHVHPINSFMADTVKTAPAGPDITLVWASDWQSTDYSSAGGLWQMGDATTLEEPDMLVFGGDVHPGYDPLTEVQADRWLDYLSVSCERWRTTDGALYPWIYLIGNHDLVGGGVGGGGKLNFMNEIFSWSYAPQHPTRFADGVATVKISSEVLIIGLDSDHGTPIDAQLDWFKDSISQAGEFRHAFVGSHSGPFSTYGSDFSRERNRSQRNKFWTFAQQFSGSGKSLRAWLQAHTHTIHASHKMLVDYDENLSASQNDLRWRLDSEGFRVLGNGPVGNGVEGNWPIVTQVSSIDGSNLYSAFIGRDTEAPEGWRFLGDTLVDSLPASAASARNVWVINLGENEWSARCLRPDGTLFYEINEIL